VIEAGEVIQCWIEHEVAAFRSAIATRSHWALLAAYVNPKVPRTILYSSYVLMYLYCMILAIFVNYTTEPQRHFADKGKNPGWISDFGRENPALRSPFLDV
jgi:hypothetical protein